MKSIITTFFFLAFLISSYAQNIYVNQAAVGANNGSSWLDAYTDLNDALNAATVSDTIRVAQGNYQPDEPDGNPGSTFWIEQDVVLLGGYNGSGATPDDRDPATYETILSGDLNGDDVDDNFDDYKSDNVMTVVTVESSITNATLIDGITIRGGYADAPGTSVNNTNSGGGLYSTGYPVLKQCTFKENYAAYRGGGAHFQYFGSQVLEIVDCDFIDNWGLRGGGLNIRNANCNITDCYFENNVAPQHGGGMRYNGDGANRDINILNCAFDDNESAFAAGLRLQTASSGNSFLLENCDFTGNKTAPYPDPAWTTGGGGLYFWNNGNNTVIEMDNCYFFQNEAEHSGSAFLLNLGGDNVDARINNCQIIENIANQYSAAVDIWGNSGGSGNLSIDSCLFDKNNSFWSGALEMGNGWGGGATVEFEVTNSSFTDNEATEGGAIGLWSSESSLTNTRFENCIIQGNTGTIRGGGIGLWPGSDDFIVKFSRCQIVDNESPLGGAVESYMLSQEIDPLEDILLQFDNCLIAGNTSPSSAAISLDSITNFSLINCTVANNFGGAIKLHDQSSVSLQNNILYNNSDTEIEDITADGIIQSNGGNLIGDNSFSAYSVGQDIQNGDPQFAGSNDYHLTESPPSPAIDKGVVSDNLSEFDLDGNPRRFEGGCVDIGAYESMTTVSTECITNTREVLAAGLLTIYPNPATDFVTIALPENFQENFTANIFDAQGKLVSTPSISYGEKINIQMLAAGVYSLKIVNEQKVFIGRFIKS